MTDADLLRRAATRLRDPYRCNTDPDVDHALAEVFDRAADAIRELQFLANTHRLTEPGLAHLADLLAVRPVARAILREPASGGVVEPSGPLTAEEATPDHVVTHRDFKVLAGIVRSGYQCKLGGDACPGHTSKWLTCDPPPARRLHDSGALIEEPDLYGKEAK